MGYIVMSSINFDNVYLLLIAIPLIVLFTVPFLLAVRKDNRNGHNIASQIMHIVMAFIIAFAAAGTSITSVLTETDIYVVADVSYSANKNLDKIDEYISRLELPRNSKLGLVCFGKDYELVSDLGKPQDIKSVKESQVDNSETNIAEALEYTGSLFDDDVIKRIVLITDGKQTDETDTYAMKRAIDILETHDVKVDAIFLDDNISEETREIQISGVEYKKSVFLNSEETATVSVQSTIDTEVIMGLYRDDSKIRERTVALTAGNNAVSFDLDTSRGGSYTYKVSIDYVEPAEGNISNDKSAYNNEYYFTQKVSDEIKVLAVAGSWNDCTALVEQYAPNASIDVYENDRHTPDDIKIKFINQYADNDKVNIYYNNIDVPSSVELLCKYDEIVLANVDITAVNDEYGSDGFGYPMSVMNPTEFVNNLDTVVSSLGKSLVTMGNLQIQTSDKPELKALDNMLPVRFGKSDDEPRLYTIVIDSSRSMNQGHRLDAAKNVATKLVNMLQSNDQICIVTFFGEVKIVQQPRPLTNPGDIIDRINSLDGTQGTIIGKGLEAAHNLIKDLPYSDKQLILITDGLKYDEKDNPVQIAADMYEDDIVTSVVGVGGDRHDSSVDELLNGVANAGHGNYTYINATGSNGEIDDKLWGEMADNIVETVVERETKVVVNRRIDESLDNINKDNIPSVSGFVNSASKASATNVLELAYTKPGSQKTKEVPLYSYWNYGKGKVSTFTSALTGDWIKSWDSVSGLKPGFLAGVFETNMPDEKTDYPYTFEVLKTGNTARVQVIPETTRFKATAKVELINPDGKKEEVVFTDLEEGYYYSYEFNCFAVGQYDVKVTYTYQSIDYLATTSLNISYASEYDEFASFEASALFKAVNGRGTVSMDGNLTIVNDENDMGTYKVDLAMPLLIACIVLYIVDIVVRKLKWEDVKSFFGGFKKTDSKKTGGNQ